MQQLDLGWIYDLYLLAQKAAREGESGGGYYRLLHHIVNRFEADSGSLSGLNDDKSSLTIIAGIDIPDHVIGTQVRVGDGILGRVAEQAEPLLLNGDVSNDNRFSLSPVRREGSQPISALCWPLLVENQPVGVICLNRGADRPQFTMDDLNEGYNIIRFVAIAVENTRLQARSERYVSELKALMKQEAETRMHLVQHDKMASIGRLSAGVAHEINNPISFISSNLHSLRDYFEELLALLDSEPAGSHTESSEGAAAPRPRNDLEFLKQDVRALICESEEGVRRVQQIVRNLREITHVNEDEWVTADIHDGLNRTLSIVAHTLKKKAEVVTEYGDLPQVECMMQQLNQVFMNILINAADAIEEYGKITIRTGCEENDSIFIEITDSGKGMDTGELKRIFEPFFTTKPVGEGTGLGLPLSWGIIDKHRGRILVHSRPGAGTTFRILLPVFRYGRNVADVAAGGSS